LRRAGERGEVELYFPRVCVIEAVAWYEREWASRVAAFEKAVSRLSQLGLRLWGDGNHPDTGIAAGHAEYLAERLALAGTLVDIPATSHEQLVRRASERRRPFNEHGSGYRDALIWESVCDLASAGPLVLLTHNSRDFGLAPDLHGDLRADLVERGIPSANVTLEADLGRLIEATVPADDAVREETELVLRGPDERNRLAEEMTASLLYVEGVPYMPSPGELPEWFDEPVAEMVWNASDVRISHAHPVDEDSYFVSGSLRADAQIYAILSEYEWGSLSDPERNRLDEVIDHGDGDMAVVLHRPVLVQFEAVFTPPSEIADVVVLSVDPDHAGPPQPDDRGKTAPGS